MKYWRRRKQERLYKQWAEHAELPPEAIPAPEMPTDMKIGGEEGNWFYRVRVQIVNVVKRILGVE